MNFKTLYEQFVVETVIIDVTLISFLNFCKERTTITVNDINTLIQVYKEGPQSISPKKKKRELENKVNNNFKVSSFYYL
jgi:hypothetical protein